MPTPEQLDEDYPDFNYVKIIRLTDKAVCFEMEDMTEGLWLPFSQVEYDDEAKTFNVPRWLAEKNNLI